jgi:hypothetical protein
MPDIPDLIPGTRSLIKTQPIPGAFILRSLENERNQLFQSDERCA